MYTPTSSCTAEPSALVLKVRLLTFVSVTVTRMSGDCYPNAEMVDTIRLKRKFQSNIECSFNKLSTETN